MDIKKRILDRLKGYVGLPLEGVVVESLNAEMEDELEKIKEDERNGFY